MISDRHHESADSIFWLAMIKRPFVGLLNSTEGSIVAHRNRLKGNESKGQVERLLGKGV